MTIQLSTTDSSTTVRIIGRIDTLTATDFDSQLQDLFKSDSAEFIFDCSEMDYISSSGLRVFLMAQKKFSQLNKKLILSGLQPSIREIFDISGFSQIFTIR